MTANPFDKANYDDCGCDISHNNGTNLDFDAMVNQGGRKYCFLKITEGTGSTGFVDPMFLHYMQDIQSTSMDKIGVYHFGHHGDAVSQVRFFIEKFKRLVAQLTDPPKFLFMLDLERGANPPNEQDGLTMVGYLQNIGINPVVYCGYDFWSRNYTALANCGHMLAAYNNHPTSAVPWRIPSADTYGWDLWQYTGDHLGPYAKDIPGGSHGMDLSCFNLKKHPQGLDDWWANQLGHTTQP